MYKSTIGCKGNGNSKRSMKLTAHQHKQQPACRRGNNLNSNSKYVQRGKTKCSCAKMTFYFIALIILLWTGILYYFLYSGMTTKSIASSVDKIAETMNFEISADASNMLDKLESNTKKYLREVTSVNLLTNPITNPLSYTLANYLEERDAESSSPEAVDKEAVPSNSLKRIAYAITVTKDGPFLDGALVLGYGIKKIHAHRGVSPSDKASIYDAIPRAPESQMGSDIEYSKYDADLVAFVTPEIVVAKHILEEYGWKVLVKDLPVELDEIQNRNYAEKMKNSGCCGASEFLKLWAYTLTDYHRVVHLDMDSIVYNSMDELFDIDKELLWTGDYNMRGASPVPPVQGGFLVIKPSMETFKEFQAIIRKGDHSGKGWGGTKIGNFWGGQTIQGILPYFYYSIHNTSGLEINRCVYNCMVDNPYYPKSNPPKCLDGTKDCQDCRLQQIDKVKSAHFTLCQKPWTCNKHDNPRNMRLCEQLHDKWFLIRSEFEKNILGLDEKSEYAGNYNPRQKKLIYRGMCKRYGSEGYIKIPLPSLQ